MTLQKHMIRFACLLLVSFIITPSLGYSHPISLSDAYVEIEKNKLQIRIEVFVEDLYLFHDLKLNDEMMLPLSEVKRGAKLHEDFLQERFKILDKEGTRLPLQFVKRVDDDLPDFDIHMVHLMFFKLVYQYEVDLSKQPKYLTFIQEFTHEKVLLPAEVLLKVKPLKGKREQKVLLPNQPWTVRLDAETDEHTGSVPLTAQQRLEKERDQTLGITSYGETYAFLYLDPGETRLEVLIPLATLAASLNLKLKPDGILDLEDQQKLKEPIRKLFEDKIAFFTDKKEHSPILDRLDFFGVAFRDFSQNASPKNVSIANARLGIILRYPRPVSAQTGILAWNLFNQFLYQVNLAIVTGEDSEKVTLRKIEKQNEYSWRFPSLPDHSIEAKHREKSSHVLQVAFQQSSQRIRFFSLLLLMFIPFEIYGLIKLWEKLKQKTGSLARVVKTIINTGYLAVFTALLCWQIDATYDLYDHNKNRQYQPQVQNSKLSQIANTLISEMYTAFNKREEKLIISQLEGVVDGELLRTLYLEIRNSMTLEEQGGAVARVGEVTISSCQIVNDSQITSLMKQELPASDNPQETSVRFLKCEWEVPGSVEHWGHIHQRTTSYLARLAIAPRKMGKEGYQWKLIGVDLLNQDQSVIKTRVRNF